MEMILTYIVIVCLVGFAFYVLRSVANIYRGPDKHWTVNEFHDMLGSFTFLGLATYMIYKEANRTDQWQLFGPLYILLVIGGFLSIIGKDKVLDVVGKIWGKYKDDSKDV